MSEAIAYSEVDSRRFGKRIYRALILDEETAKLACDFARHQPVDIDMMIARCPARALPLVHMLERAGFSLMDTHVVYRGSTSPFVAEANRPGVEIRSYQPDDAPELEAVARKCFDNYDGHSHADDRLDKAACTEGYVEWCLSATTDSRFYVLVSICEGRTSGFLTLRTLSANLGEIVLNGVAPEYQRCGVYDTLFKAAGLLLYRQGVSELIVATHVNNVAAQKVWTRNGLELHEVSYTLHCWFQPSGNRQLP